MSDLRIGLQMPYFSGAGGGRQPGRQLAAVARTADDAGFGRFPPVAERFERLEETLRICIQMWQGGERPFNGHYYQLERPLNRPQALSAPHRGRRRGLEPPAP